MHLFVELVAAARDVILIVLGIYATGILKKQLELKHAEIEVRKAREEHLEKMSAPALADQVQKMAPLLNDYAKKNAELEEKQRGFPDAVAKAAQVSNAMGIGAGTLNAILAIQELMTMGAVQAGLSGQELPPWIQKLAELVSTDLTPLANEAFKGKMPELPHVRNGIALAGRESLKQLR